MRISGAPLAEYGDKTSLVIDVTTRSGLGASPPHGNLTASYGTFGSSSLDFNFSIAVYNFPSTFSGTHYVTPRTITGEIGIHF